MSTSIGEGFDTREAGTPERQWRSLLAASLLLEPLPPGVLIVAPHPDDETLGAGGLLQRCSDAMVLLVTNGEAAHPRAGNLGARRQQEAKCALRTMGHRTPPVFIGLPDGHVSAHEQQLERSVTYHLHGISTLVSPYEFDGHPDHDAVGRVCIRLARRHRLRLLRYPIWAWHRCGAADFRAVQFVRLPLSAREQRLKRRAVACFGSQLDGGRTAVLPAHVLEYFERPYEAFLPFYGCNGHAQ